MPNDLINALLGQQTEVPRQPSPFGAEPPRPEDAISNLYRSNAPKSSWLDTLSKFTPGPSDRGKPPPPGEGFWEGFQKQGILPAALMGARASGVRLTPSTRPGRDPTLQLRVPRPNPLPPKDFINPILMTKPYPKKREADASKDQPQHDWRRSGMMHMEQGGYNPGQPMVVGENGPEVVVPGGPSSVIPNSLAVQSGMLKAPPKAASEVDRLFESPGKPLREVMPNIGTAIAPAGALKAIGSAIGAFPKTAATIGTGAGIAGMTSGVGEAADQTGFPEPRPELPTETQAKLKGIKSEIEKHNATLARHAALKEDKPALYASRTAGALAALQRLTGEASAIEGPHNKNVEGWQDRLNSYMLKNNQALLQQQQQAAAASQPFQEKHPWWNEEVQKYGSGAEALLGSVAGITGKGKVLKPMLTGAGVGGLSGALAAAYPNLQDAGYLPFGSENQKKAWGQLTNPSFLGTKVLPEALGGAGLGALGAYTGSKGPQLVKAGADSIKAIAKWLKNPTGAKAPPVPRAKAAPAPPSPVVTQPPPMATQPPPILPEAVVPTPVKRTRKKKTTE